MKESISRSERLDIFLALATFYKFDTKDKGKVASDDSEIDLSLLSMSALDEKDLNIIKDRAKRFESLSSEKQKAWQTFWLEKLRNRETTRLDENLHSAHIVQALIEEPQTIQSMIYSNLPDSLAKKVSELLPEITQKTDNAKISEKAVNLPVDEISTIVRNKFLSNFVAFENIYKPNDLDDFSPDQLEEFIWKLGIREIAISCRGIKTKENLAVFLKPFNETNTREIAVKITELEKIEANRVVISEKIVNETFRLVEDSKKRIENLGLQLLAMTLIFRDYNAKKYTSQKLPIDVSKIIENFTEQFEMQYKLANQSIRNQFNELGKEIQNIAAEYKEEFE